MSRHDSSAASQRARRALEKVESLCCEVLDNIAQPTTLGVPGLLALEDAFPKFDQVSVWDAVSERALAGLVSIYVVSIRRSSPLLETRPATEAQHQASVRAALSRGLLDAGVVNHYRAQRLGLAILSAQTLRCYAVLLGDATASLSRQPSKRNEDAAHALLSEVAQLTVLLAFSVKLEVKTGSALRVELVTTLATELTASSFLEHWARLVLTLASCEGSQRALEKAASQLFSFSFVSQNVLQSLDPGCAHSLLAASPCLSYLLTSQLVALCAELDGGTVYGMPEAPGRALFTAALAVPTVRGDPPRMEKLVELCGETLAQLPRVLHLRLLQAPDLAKGSAHGASAPAAALYTAVAAADAPAAELMAVTGGLRAAASDGGQEAGQQRQEDAHGASVQRSLDAGTGPTAATAADAGMPSGARLSLPSPASYLEVSLRLATVLCSVVMEDTGSAQVQVGGGSTAANCLTAFKLQLAGPAPRVKVFKAAKHALGLALYLLGESSATARRRRRLASVGCGSSSAGGVPAGASWAPSPLERWWEAAVAMGDALAAAAARLAGDRGAAKEFGVVLEHYLLLQELVTSWETTGSPSLSVPLQEPPDQPSDCVAAALSAGFLPCLERLLRGALQLPLPLHSKWAQQWCRGWDAAWAEMLLFADLAQVAAVIDAAVEGLRMAVAAASATNGSKDGDNNNVRRLEDAIFVAAGLGGCGAIAWLPNLAGGPSSEPGKLAFLQFGEVSPGSGPASGLVTTGLQARLSESLTLITTRLMPELSRALLGGLLPAFHRGSCNLDSVCLILDRQLQWVPAWAGGLAAESRSAAAAAAEKCSSASGGAETGSAGGSGGSCSPRVHRWRQLLLVELRLPGLLGAAISLLQDRDAGEVCKHALGMRRSLRTALDALATLVPAELARMVVAADRAEAAAASRPGAGRHSSATAALTAPPSSGLLRRALGPGGPLEDAELLAAVEAACASGAGGGGAPTIV